MPANALQRKYTMHSISALKHTSIWWNTKVEFISSLFSSLGFKSVSGSSSCWYLPCKEYLSVWKYWKWWGKRNLHAPSKILFYIPTGKTQGGRYDYQHLEGFKCAACDGKQCVCSLRSVAKLCFSPATAKSDKKITLSLMACSAECYCFIFLFLRF